MDKQRTLKQNAALHKWCEMLALELNEAGLTVMETLRHDAEIPWTKERIKELMVKPIIKASYDKTSTTELTTKELSDTAEIITRHLGQKFGISTAFPSVEDLINNSLIKEDR